MLGRSLLTLLICSAPFSSARAQHGGGSPQPAATAPVEARQLDFLVGQWELAVKVPAQGLAQRIHGAPRMVGSWKAWRAFDGFGIEDELRITDLAGNPLGLSHSLRIYDRAAKRWSVTLLDVYRGTFTPATAEWREGQLTQSSRGTDLEGKPYLSRARFYAITPTSFKYQQDRSFDDGKSWKEGVLRMEATRVAAAAPR